jgi:hypothetical protein
MDRRRHPVKDEYYELIENGVVRVSNEDSTLVGVFTADGRWQSGNLKYADPHMVQWIGGLQATGTLSSAAGEGGEEGSS